MLDIHRDDGPDTKIYFSHSTLPNYIDPQNVSTKKKPFSTFNAQPFSHTLDLILPEEIYELVRSKLEEESRTVYAKVFMTLSDILEPEFLEPYVKQGNITLLSSPSPLTHPITLHNGNLTLTLPRPTFERTGLPGTPLENGGAKHQKNLYRVSYDLRSPSMTPGKKGFARLQWAARNVLNESLSWLFWNANPSSGESLREGREPVSRHHPTICEVVPEVQRLGLTRVPRVTPGCIRGLCEGEGEDALALQEYVAMVGMGSQRVRVGDRIDPHLSRYEVPDLNGEVEVVGREMVRVRWRGLITEGFVRRVFLLVRGVGLRVGKEGATKGEGGEEEERWVAWQAAAFGGRKGWTVMQWAGRETLVWECED